MKNKELQKILRRFPDDMPVMMYFNHNPNSKLYTFDRENITDHAPDDRVSEKGNLVKGKEPRVLVINPPIY